MNIKNKKSLLQILLFLCLFILFGSEKIFAYKKIKVIALDRTIFKEIKIPTTWIYTGCQDSFIEYPEIVEPTIHYVLQFTDAENHKIELKFSRFNGKLDKNAILYDMTEFSENYIEIR